MLKYNYILLALLALPLFVQGQSSTLSRQRISLIAAPNLSYFASKGDVGDQTPRLGFHARLDGEWRLSNRVWLRVGAGWTLMRYKTDVGKFLQWPSQVENGVYNPSLPGESLIVLQEDQMLTIPIALRFFMGKKQHFYADVESGGSLIFRQQGNDVIRPNLGASLGFQTAVATQTWLFIQPTFRLLLDNLNSGINLKSNKSYPYSLGLELGVRRGLH